ncbi:hypothetical protein FB446DRAFT_818121 [Lentinula raphanica]|nr:hypothetical protein FB446DRAFT_818121 [Lentinula raphanica]
MSSPLPSYPHHHPRLIHLHQHLLLSMITRNPPRTEEHDEWTAQMKHGPARRARAPTPPDDTPNETKRVKIQVETSKMTQCVPWSAFDGAISLPPSAPARSKTSSEIPMTTTMTTITRSHPRPLRRPSKGFLKPTPPRALPFHGDSLHPPSQFDVDESEASEAKPIDTRSTKSFENMLSDGKRRAKARSANGNAAKPYPNHGSTYHS